MCKKIVLSLFFIIIAFSGCGTKNNIAKKEDYKILDEVSIISNNDNKVFGKSGATPYICKVASNKYFDDIMNVNNFNKFLKDNNAKVTYIEPTKKLIVVNISYYFTGFNMECDPERIGIFLNIYDVEDISKNWNKENMEYYLKSIKSLDDKKLIYSQKFILDKNYNTYTALDYQVKSFMYNTNKDNKKDINKFHQEIIKELEKVMKFPQ
ncbi:hypothetical protein NG744_09255 [Aliarcobacter cryaerophilus]|uniref:hypothetical protein n=1 Tax=Aliarcobacter cryaerophilus TaxID=28198 RepID=UPI003DA27F0C